MTKEQLMSVALEKTKLKPEQVINRLNDSEEYLPDCFFDLKRTITETVNLLYEEKKFVDSINNMDKLISINYVDEARFSAIKGNNKNKVTEVEEINDILEQERKHKELNLNDSFELWGYASNHGEFDGFPDTDKCSRIYICYETIEKSSRWFENNINKKYKETLGKFFKFEVSSSFFRDPSNLLKIVFYHELGHCIAGHSIEDGYSFDKEREAQFYCSVFFNSHIWSVYLLYISLFQPIEYQQRFLLHIDGIVKPRFFPQIFIHAGHYPESDSAISKFYNIREKYDYIKNWWLSRDPKDYPDYKNRMERDLLGFFWFDISKYL
jgi:hypothetical protein